MPTPLLIILAVLGGLVGILLLLFAVAVLRTLFLKEKHASYEMSDEKERIDAYAEKLSKMIQKPTVSIRGVEQPELFREFHEVLASLFPNVFATCEKIEIDGNLMMRWRGSDPSLDPIILISHQDVVEANDNGEWLYPPFSGTIADGRIYGRGAGDIKCGVMCFYQAVEELIAEGYTPKCDVYLGSSCTEEIGGDGAPKLVKWFQDRNIHLFMLSDEGGCIVEDPVGGVKGAFAAIGIFEKGYGDLKLTAKSAGGHSSTPPKHTPIARLAAFENEIETKNPFVPKFSPAVEGMFGNLAPYCENFMLKVVMHNLWLFKPILKYALGAISAEAAAMLKTTICFTMQKGSNGYNVIPGEAWVTANLRYIPHENMKKSNEKIAAIAKKYNIDCELVTGNDFSKPLDLSGAPYRMTVDCIRKIFPNVGIMPYVVTGGTDSRFFDPVCDNCVRFSPVLSAPDQMSGMHGINENIFAGALPKGVDYFKELIKMQETR